MKWFALVFTLLLCAETFLNHEAVGWRRRRLSRRRCWVSAAWTALAAVASFVGGLASNVRVDVSARREFPGEGCSASGSLDYRERGKRDATPGMSFVEGFMPQDASRLKLMTCSLAKLFSQRGAQHIRRHKKDIKAVQKVLDESNRILSLMKSFPATAEALRQTSCSTSLPLLSACALGYLGSLPTKLTHEAGTYSMETDLTPCQIDPVDVDRNLTWHGGRNVTNVAWRDWFAGRTTFLRIFPAMSTVVTSDLCSQTQQDQACRHFLSQKLHSLPPPAGRSFGLWS